MSLNASVLVVGGGPVGMTLALELARHGIRSTLVERNHDTTRHPKMDLTNGRSMELFRRLGLSDALRAAGVSEQNPWDIMWATSPTGQLLHNFRYASSARQREAAARANDGSATAEPGMRVSQIVLEPVLRAAMDANPLIDARFGWKFEELRQDEHAVTSLIRNLESDATVEIRSDFVAGCDGGGSRVRRCIGVELEGVGQARQVMLGMYQSLLGADFSAVENVGRMLMIHFKSSDHALLNPWGVAWHLQTGIGSMVAQNDTDTWTVHMGLPPGVDESTLDPAAMLRSFVGRDFDFEILVANPWAPLLVIAESYAKGRVFLAGDSVHQVIPTGGYGMNTGIGDAIDLGWKLAAVIKGWGGEGLLQSYESERKPIAIQNRAASQGHFEVRIAIAKAFMEAQAEGDLDEAGPAGEARRARLAATIARLGNAENESWGIEHGYRYGGSPVIAEAGAGTPPPFDKLRCTPTTFPGARLPHVMLESGSSLIDELGEAFTLIVIGDADSGAFPAAAETLGIPLKVLRLKTEPALALLERPLLLVRPDQHIAWRGDTPTAPEQVLAHAVGRSGA